MPKDSSGDRKQSDAPRQSAAQRRAFRKLEAERAGRGARRLNDPFAQRSSGVQASAAAASEAQASAASVPAPTPPPTGGISAAEGGGGPHRGPPVSPNTAPAKTAVDWETGADLAKAAFKPDVAVTMTVRNTRPPERAIERRQREEREAQRELIRLCRDHTKEAVDTLADIMRDKNQKGVARVAAAKTIIEFGHGKAQSTLNIQRVFSPEELALVAKALVEKRLVEQGVKGAIDGGKLESSSG